MASTPKSHRPTSPRRRAACGLLAASAGLLGALGAPAAASADASSAPGQVHIEVTCGSETFAATSGRGGAAAWVAERDGRRVVLLPASVSGTTTSADGAVRAFSQDLGGRGAGGTTTCSFAFDLDTKGDVVSIAGQGEFVVQAG